MKKILLVEDDESLGYILKEYLQMNDFDVNWQKDGEQGLNAFGESAFDICILDIMLPIKDGLTLAAELKEIDSGAPIIFLTAKSLKIDKLKGFKVGCDDYIVKPVDEEELIARINAVLRRTGGVLPEKTKYSIGAYIFEPNIRQLTLDGNSSRLSEKESEILAMLCSEQGELVERNKIMKALWNENNYFNRRSMDVFISKLRKHLGSDTSLRIKNIHGKGFILEQA